MKKQSNGDTKSRDFKLVFFDLGGVIVDVHIEKFYKKVAQRTGQSFEHVVQAAVDFIPDTEKFARGLISPKAFFDIIFQEHNSSINYDQFHQVYVNIFNLKKKVVEIARQLKQNYHISIISNTDVLHYNYIMQNYSSLKIFAKPTTSFETHSLKPEKEIYHFALKKFQLPPKACIFIDDRKENVQAAQSVGIKGIHFNGEKNLIEELKKMEIKIHK